MGGRGAVVVAIGVGALTACTLTRSLDYLSRGAAAAGDAAATDADPLPLPATDADATEDAGDDASSVTSLDAGPCDDPGLVAAWRFDEGAGDEVHDCTMFRHDGRLVGAVWVAGLHGEAIALSGGGWASFGNPLRLQITGPLTVAAWIKSSATSISTEYLVGKTTDVAVGGWRLSIDPNAEMSIAAGGGANAYVRGDVVPLNAWTHVASVYRPGAGLDLYVGGALVATNPTGVPPALIDQGDDLRVGARSDGLAGFNGAIDETRIYDRALTATEIGALARR